MKVSNNNSIYTIILFYKYVNIDNPEQLKTEQKILAEKLSLKGRVIVAKEGINATLEGTNENIEQYLKEYLSDPRFADTHIKKSKGTGNAFPKLSVKVRPEIVSLHLEDDIDPNQITGTHLKPEELKKWYDEGKEFYVIDMRNDYEFKVGRFKDSVLMPVQNFRDIPSALSHIEHLKNKTVVPVCTGGVRCEKASGLLVREGFKDVYQLDGGIVSYMEKFPAGEFEGSLYVFDKRILMHFDPEDKHVVVGACEKCNAKSERYVNCKNPECNKHFICCENCSEEDGRSFCSSSCKDKVVTKNKDKFHHVAPFILQNMFFFVFLPVYKIFVKLEIIGKENLERLHGPVILAPNHTSELDPTVIPLIFPFLSHLLPIYSVIYPIARYKTASFKWRRHVYNRLFFHLLGGYSSYSGSKDYNKSLKDHISLLGKGRTVCIFPEGKCTTDGSIGKAHGGLAFLAYKTNAAVVPIYINTFFGLTFWDFILRRKKITITILPKMTKGQIITTDNPTVEDFRNGSQIVLNKIKELA